MGDLLREIWESLRQNKFRTAMTGFAVVWGIFILVVLLGASNGLENGMQANYGSRRSNSVDIWGQWRSVPYKGLPTNRMLRFTDKEANIIRHLPEVELFSRVSARYSDVVYGKESIFAKTKSALFTKRKVQQNFKSSKLLSRKFAAFFNV